ncbi:MAG: hypothetical protein V4616_14195 [Bacteroidota bacterium]
METDQKISEKIQALERETPSWNRQRVWQGIERSQAGKRRKKYGYWIAAASVVAVVFSLFLFMRPEAVPLATVPQKVIKAPEKREQPVIARPTSVPETSTTTRKLRAVEKPLLQKVETAEIRPEAENYVVQNEPEVLPEPTSTQKKSKRRKVEAIVGVYPDEVQFAKVTKPYRIQVKASFNRESYASSSPVVIKTGFNPSKTQ